MRREEVPLPEATADAQCQQLLQLDAALQKLSTADRDVIVARYFQGQTAAQVAQQFHISIAAAEKRISRAMDKLRTRMTRTGVTLDSVAVAALLASGAGTAPPAELISRMLQQATGAAPISSTATHAARHIAFRSAHIPAIAGAAAVALALGLVAVIVPTTIHSRGGFVDYVAMFNQRFGKGVTPKNNAAVPLLILFRPQTFQGGRYQVVAGKMVFVADKNWAKRFRTALGITDQDLTGPRFVHYQSFRKRADPAAIVGATPAGRPPATAPMYVPNRCYEQPWSAHANPWVAAWLHTNSGAMDVAEAACARPQFFMPLVAESPRTAMAFVQAEMNPPNPYGFVKSVAGTLICRAMLELQRGKIKSCEADLLAAHRCGLLISHEHFLLTAMIASSIQYMASRADIALANSGKLSAQADIAYLHRLQALGTPVPVATDFDTAERWLLLSSIENPTGNIAGSPVPTWQAWLFGAFYAHAMANVNQFLNQLVASIKARSSLTQITGLHKDFLMWHRESPHATAASTINLDLQSAAGGIADQAGAIASARMARIAFALAAYLKKHAVYPNRLAQLEPAYLSMIPRDPYTGKPFDYITGPNGCTLSSPARFPSRLTAGVRVPPDHPIVAHLSLPAGQ